jgi:hypothetical protein
MILPLPMARCSVASGCSARTGASAAAVVDPSRFGGQIFRRDTPLRVSREDVPMAAAGFFAAKAELLTRPLIP